MRIYRRTRISVSVHGNTMIDGESNNEEQLRRRLFGYSSSSSAVAPPSPTSSSSSMSDEDDSTGRTTFTNRKPAFPTRYHELLQPLSPVTTVGPSVPSCTPPPDPTHALDRRLQCDFERMIVRGTNLDQVSSFLDQHSGSIDVNALLTYDGDDADDRHRGQAGVHVACARGDCGLLRLLWRHGADLRLANRDGFSPVHLASFQGDIDLLSFLLQNVGRKSA